MKKHIIAVGAVAALAVSLVATAGLKTEAEKTSYAMGFETGAAMHQHDIVIDQPSYLLGLKEGLQGKAKTMTEDQIKQAIMTFQKKSIANFKAKLAVEAKENLQKGTVFLAKNEKIKGVKTTESGLQYKILKKGDGPVPTKKDTVVVDYSGKLLDGKVFDSSYKRGKKATFPVSAVIKGWQEALTLMHAGGTWELYIPAKLAYGKMGAPGMIGPNQTLIFKVKLYSIKK